MRLHARQPQRDALGLRELMQLAELRGSLRVHEVHALEVEHERPRPVAVG